MLQFYYNPKYKYTNRSIIDISSDSNYVSKDYENIDSPDTINGHIIYKLSVGENLPTYIFDTETQRRWFVSGITQLRSGKFQISLLRDIISEGSSPWKTEEAYITAGLATDYNKYKTWGLPFTNTKVREERLNINGKSSFFIYYVNTQTITANAIVESDLNIKYTLIPGVQQYDYEIQSFAEIPGYTNINAGQLKNDIRLFYDFTAAFYDSATSTYSTNNYSIAGWEYPASAGTFTQNINDSGSVYRPGYPGGNRTNYLRIDAPWTDVVMNNVNNSRTNLYSALNQWVNTYINSIQGQISTTDVDSLNAYVGKIIYNSTEQKAYRLNLSTTSVVNRNTQITASDMSTFVSAVRNINWPILNVGGVIYDNVSTIGDTFFKGEERYSLYNYTLEEIGNAISLDFNLIAGQRKLPKSAVRCVNIVSNDTITDFELTQALMLAQTNALNLSEDTGRILDVQFLPFSIATEANSNIKINNTNMTARFLDTDDYYYVNDLQDITNINKETDSINIVSPSRASQFIFKQFNNNGNMLFETKITLKPYASVIYVRPSTQGLLISDWDDKNCLIINEDFSLTVVNSEWANYVYQNRNYENAFNRQIQGREIERGWERRIEEAQAKSDEWTSRNISSQKAQSYTGNLPIISGIAGAIGSAWQDQDYLNAAKVDREYNEALYQESIDIAKDNYKYQLDNLKSQPNIPSKVTTIDCKFLDGIYLEFYSTNPSELTAIRNFYKYNGNRIDAYGTFAQYYGWFVRGKIIKSLNYTQPEIDEVNRRLNLGIFTEVEYA